MDRTACKESQCLYKGALNLFYSLMNCYCSSLFCFPIICQKCYQINIAILHVEVLSTGTRALLVSTLRQTILQLETSIQSSFMHPNWPLLRKPWITAVSACINPRDFARALIVLQACIKPVVFAPVWHEALGHVRMQRLTSAEREERKRLDKKDKKDKEEEEERNRLTYNFVKYTLGLKHMVYSFIHSIGMCRM